MSLDDTIERAVIVAVEKALAPHLRRLADPEPLVYSVPDAAKVLCTSTNTVRRLVDDGVLPTVPHMGQRVLIPRAAVARLVESGVAVARAAPQGRNEPANIPPTHMPAHSSQETPAGAPRVA